MCIEKSKLILSICVIRVQRQKPNKAGKFSFRVESVEENETPREMRTKRIGSDANGEKTDSEGGRALSHHCIIFLKAPRSEETAVFAAIADAPEAGLEPEPNEVPSLTQAKEEPAHV